MIKKRYLLVAENNDLSYSIVSEFFYTYEEAKFSADDKYIGWKTIIIDLNNIKGEK